MRGGGATGSQAQWRVFVLRRAVPPLAPLVGVSADLFGSAILQRLCVGVWRFVPEQSAGG